MLRLFALILLCSALSTAAAQDLRLPFKGRWFIVQGGDTPNVNQHMELRAQWFGIDFAKLGGPTKRELSIESPSRLEHFFSWGEPVLAPADGEIITVVNDLPDNELGIKDKGNPAGNHVVIKTVPNRFVFLAHFQRGSILVKPGSRVARGQLLGKCGNSGNSDYPHIHLHVQDLPALNTGNGQNTVFSNMDVELNGKIFENVAWPIIRALFVTAR